MKAQLVKRQDRFDLYNESDGSKIASTLPNPMGKLSLKNCEAIANGYDLDVVVEDIVKTIVPNDRGEDIWYGTSMSVGKLCFQKALELLGDKKFNDFLDKEKELGISDIKTIERIQWYYKTYFDKSQQTEFDIEIVMECCGKVYSQHCDGTCEHVKPLLDADGCIILKRK